MENIDFSQPNFKLDLAIAMSIGWSKSKDDKYHWIRPDGSTTNIIPNYSKDATLALEALQKIMEIKDIYRSILDITPDQFIIKIGDATASSSTPALAICKSIYKLL